MLRKTLPISSNKIKAILATATFAYFVTVVERSSMGVASLPASERFQVGAATLSSLAVAQLVVYAAMQIPTGLALDRFGPKRLIVFGSIMTGLGNLVVALAPILAVAVAGRMLVGFGDAFIFVSGIRLIDGWVTRKRATRVTQLFANVGQLGQIASAIPFAYLLRVDGWAPAFTVVAGLAFIAAAASMLFLRDEPEQLERRELTKSITGQLRENLGDPNTRKAFWVHFTLQSSGSMFILLWGYPFLVQGEGLPPATSGLLLSSFVLIGFFVGPILSSICVRFPGRRYQLVLGVYSLIVASWLVVLLTPGKNPLWQLILLVISIGIGGPASMIAFDYSRGSIPKYRLGSSNGIINSGGFVATFLAMFLVGVMLDLIHSSGILGASHLYDLAAFKLAFPIHLLVISAGAIFFLKERRITLRE